MKLSLDLTHYIERRDKRSILYSLKIRPEIQIRVHHPPQSLLKIIITHSTPVTVLRCQGKGLVLTVVPLLGNQDVRRK